LLNYIILARHFAVGVSYATTGPIWMILALFSFIHMIYFIILKQAKKLEDLNLKLLKNIIFY
jgi:hypothetical protein